VANYGFDVTPARLGTGLITERGLLKAERNALVEAFPEQTNGIRERSASPLARIELLAGTVGTERDCKQDEG